MVNVVLNFLSKLLPKLNPGQIRIALLRSERQDLGLFVKSMETNPFRSYFFGTTFFGNN